jgi:hypothetical protein
MLCPICGACLEEIYVAVGGGIWLSASENRMKRLISGYELEIPTADKTPLHCLIGTDGYHRGNWPLRGFFCQSCTLIMFQTKAVN